MIEKIIIKMCSDGTHGSLFICGVYGDVTLESLNEINSQIIDDETDNDWEAGVYTVECSHNKEERGEYGRIEHAAYWDVDFIGFEPFE